MTGKLFPRSGCLMNTPRNVKNLPSPVFKRYLKITGPKVLSNNISAIWVIYNHFIESCKQLETFGKITKAQSYLVIEIASIKIRYNWKHLGKLDEFHSDLHIL